MHVCVGRYSGEKEGAKEGRAECAERTVGNVVVNFLSSGELSTGLGLWLVNPLSQPPHVPVLSCTRNQIGDRGPEAHKTQVPPSDFQIENKADVVRGQVY